MVYPSNGLSNHYVHSALLFSCLVLVDAGFLKHAEESKSPVTAVGLCAGHLVDANGLPPYDHVHYQSDLAQAAKFHRRLPREERELAKALETVYEAPLLLSAEMLEEGLSTMGDTRRLERTMFKLLKGQPIKVVTLGGSITAGVGIARKENGWTERVFAWINATFPHNEHEFLNEAIPAVTSAYVSPCVMDMVPEDTDMVILEFTINDMEYAGSYTSFDFDEPIRRGTERLLRKLMRMKHKPGLLYLHTCNFVHSTHFYDGVEDRHDVLMKFYGMPTLSMRNALHLLVEQQPELLDQMWYPVNSDRLHPSCIGYKFIADQVIGYLQDLAAMLLRSHSAHESPPHPEVLTEPLGPPLFNGNFAEKPETCMANEEFRSFAARNEGWVWVNEGKLIDKPKWGFVSTDIGSLIELKIPIHHEYENNRLVIALGVLMSWEHMGDARVECSGGCTCEAREFPLHTLARVSMTYWRGLQVSLDHGSKECRMLITNIDRLSKEHKLKLTSVYLSGELDYVECTPD